MAYRPIDEIIELFEVSEGAKRFQALANTVILCIFWDIVSAENFEATLLGMKDDLTQTIQATELQVKQQLSCSPR